MNKHKGFAILYTMLIVTMALSLSVGVANLAYKERSLTRLGRDSLGARAAADVGMECMLYNDKVPTQFDPNRNPVQFPMFCGRDDQGTPVNYFATLTSSSSSNYVYTVDIAVPVNGACFKAYIERDLLAVPIATKIDVFGYNICDTANPNRVERGIIAEY